MYNSQYSRSLYISNQNEMRKKPGQTFCDKYNWRLTDRYNLIQRPDKIQFMNGTLYRTHTHVYHIWYENIKKNNNIWIEFNGNRIIVKSGIKVTCVNLSPMRYQMSPDPSCYKEIKYFYDGMDVVNYLIQLDTLY